MVLLSFGVGYSSAMTWRYAFCINLIDVLPEKLYN